MPAAAAPSILRCKDQRLEEETLSSGTIFWILLLVVGPLLMVFMHRGHGGRGAGQGASEQDAGGHRHRGC